MEVRRAAGQAAKNRSLDLPDVVKSPINQGLPEIRRGLAIIRWQAGAILFTYRDERQIAHVQSSEVDERRRGIGVPRADV